MGQTYSGHNSLPTVDSEDDVSDPLVLVHFGKRALLTVMPAEHDRFVANLKERFGISAERADVRVEFELNSMVEQRMEMDPILWPAYRHYVTGAWVVVE
ncbi:hypothetical protein PIIN_08577 [Serendipita indica DSM 11827]|uniref:Uncharacterized protein n=1 Tax=Serendipita indica (strain DSM 11827) TaxID=1109443 RepID=G4TTI2_SERID|nr:hypothetical protein PIIN_08577 [Serendipita indica DSM 11827]